MTFENKEIEIECFRQGFKKVNPHLNDKFYSDENIEQYLLYIEKNNELDHLSFANRLALRLYKQKVNAFLDWIEKDFADITAEESIYWKKKKELLGDKK